MPSPAKLIVLIFSLCLANTSVNAQHFDKYLGKYQKYFEKGDYDKALGINDQLIKKSTKKLGPTNKYLPLAYLNQAKIQLRKGMITGIETSLERSIRASTQNSGPESVDHAGVLLEAARLSVQYGNYLLADSALQQAVAVYKKKGELTDDLEAEMLILDLGIKLNRGFYMEAVGEFLDKKAFLADRANSDKGKKADRELRVRQLAAAINDVADAYLRRGSVQQADSVLKSNAGWFEKSLGRKDDESVVNEMLFGRLHEALHDDKTAEKHYEDALAHAQSGRKDFDPLVLQAQQALIMAYYRFGKTNQAQNETVRFKKAVEENFPKQSFQRLKIAFLDLEDNLYKHDNVEAVTLATRISEDETVLPEDHVLKILANQALYEIYDHDQDTPKARAVLENTLKIQGHLYGSFAPVYHLSLLKDAGYQIEYGNNLDKIDSLVHFSWEKVAKKELDFDHPDYIEIQNNLADYYNLTDNYVKAKEALDAALQATVKKYQGRTDVQYAKGLMRIASLQIDLGQFDRSQKYLDMAMNMLWDKRKEGDNLYYYVDALNTEAKLYTTKGMYDEAEDVLKKSRKLLKKADVPGAKDMMPGEDVTAINIKLGRFGDAGKSLDDGIANIEANYGRDNKALINPLTVLGRLKLTTGDYTEANKLAHRAFDIAQAVYGQGSTRLIGPLSLLADISSSFGDQEKAEEQLTKAINIQRAKLGDDHIQLASLDAQLGLVKLHRKEDFGPIRKLFREAKDIYLYALDAQNPQYADMLKKLAYVDIAEKQYDSAFQLLAQAEEIWKSKTGSRNNVNTAEICVLQGDVYYMLSNYGEARNHYNKAGALYTKYFTRNHPNYVKVQAKLSRVAYMQGDLKEAMTLIEQVIDNDNAFIKAYFPTLTEREKAKYWNKIREDYEYYNTVVLKRVDGPDDKLVGKLYDNALNTKALLLDTSIKMRENILKSQDTTLIAQFNEWLLDKDLLTQMLSMSTAQLAENPVNVDSLKTRIENLEVALSRKSTLFDESRKNRAVTWEQVRSSLKENESAVEMVRFRYFDKVLTDSVVYAALILGADGRKDRPQVLLLKNGRQLENRFFKYYKNMILFQMKDDQSYGHFWRPIQDAIGQNKTVYFSPDGVYAQMNLETLQVDSSHYVLDNSNIVLVNNTKDLVVRKASKNQGYQTKRALIMGDPQFYVSVKPDLSPGHQVVQGLPGTGHEVEGLTQLFVGHGWKTDHYVKTDATEGQVKMLENPEVFHIATHGFYTAGKRTSNNGLENIDDGGETTNPLLRSGLLLKGAGDILSETKYNYNIENGILTAYEAMNLHLDQTKLVVLSACETGVGDVTVGEGVYGLQRAFLVAGAKTLVMSMFKVNDQTTSELMVTFYRRWLDTGNLRESFIEAKKEIRNKYHDPVYWGSFVMIGLE